MVWLIRYAWLPWAMFGLVYGLSMSPNDYRRLVMNRCYNQTEHYQPWILGQRKPVGMAVDYFVSLVEKIEDRLPPHLTSATDVINLLLRRFHYDGVENIAMRPYVDFQQIQNQWEANRRVITEMLTPQNDYPQTTNWSFPEEILTEDEKCAMFFMISHSINQTTQDELGDPIIKETGIVSLLNNQYLAIAMNSVLLGIAVGLQNVQTKSIVLEQMDPVDIDPLMAVTLSNKLATAAIQSILIFPAQVFGTRGMWNSTFCQSEHRLPPESNHMATMAEINGAVDGWLIGDQLRSDTGRSLRDLKLSQLIDRYYSKHGISPNCGICSTGLMTDDIMYSVQENSKIYAHLWNKLFNHGNFEYERIDGYVYTLSDIYNQYIQKSNEDKRSECAQLQNSDLTRINYDTKSDLYIMIDNNAFQYSQFHLETITKLLVRLKSLDLLGTVTIMANAHKGFDSEQMSTNIDDLKEPLHLIVYNSSSVQKATCRMAWYPYRETTITNMKLLLNNLVKFFDRDNVTHPEKRRSKNFIWFSLKQNSYEKLTERERIYYFQSRWYLLFNLNVRMFFISNFEQNLDHDMSQLMLNKYDWFKVNPMEIQNRLMVERLVQRISETPLPVRLEHCGNLTTGNQFIEENSVDTSKKQTWVMYPKYFLDSEEIHIKFESSYGQMRVCLGRWQFPELNRTQCKETGAGSPLVEFYVPEPCPWKIMETCRPIYFTVTVKNDHQNKCLGSECRHPIAPWTVSYSGLTCSKNWASSSVNHLHICLFFLSIIVNMIFAIYYNK